MIIEPTGEAIVQAVKTFSVTPDRLLNPLPGCKSWLNPIIKQLQMSVAAPLPISPEQESLIRMHIQDWDIVLNALYKKEIDSRHKVPAPIAVRKAIKPWVTFLQKMFLLCERVHTLQDDLTAALPYPNARQFFLAAVYEIRLWDIVWDLYHEEPLSTEQSHKRNTRISGKPFLMGRKETISKDNFRARDMFKNRQNLFDPNLQPHQFTMIQSALTLAESPNFRETYWAPFCKAYAHWVREIDRNSTYFVPIKQNGKIMRQSEGNRLEVIS